MNLSRIKRWSNDWTYFILILTFAIDVLSLGVYFFPNNADSVLTILGLFFALLGTIFYGTAVPTISPRLYTGSVTNNNDNTITLSTRMIIKNVSSFSARAYVNVNLKFNDNLVWVPDSYDGSRPWNLFPEEGIDGHFETTVSRDEIRNNSRLEMKLKVRNAGFSQYIIKYPIGHWHFEFNRNQWYNEDFGYYA